MKKMVAKTAQSSKWHEEQTYTFILSLSPCAVVVVLLPVSNSQNEPLN